MPTALSWSSGKDSALALHHLRQNPELAVQKLLTTVHGQQQEIAMHGVGPELIRAQARSIGLPVDIIRLPEISTDAEYGAAMKSALEDLKSEGIGSVAFGDILLEDVRRYREKQMMSIGMEAVFPLWGRSTADLAEVFIREGFRAVVVCIDGSVLDQTFLGREYNAEFLRDLPKGVDPAGENGEFHTFCFDGPVFQYAVEWERGAISYKDFPAPKPRESQTGLEQSNADAMRFWFLEISLATPIAGKG